MAIIITTKRKSRLTEATGGLIIDYADLAICNNPNHSVNNNQ